MLTSAAASCQTTILPATRTMLSMGSHGAAPPKLAQHRPQAPHPRLQHLAVRRRSRSSGTCCWSSSATTPSTDAYSASIAAVGMAIAVYYGLSGISCIVYYRRFLITIDQELRADRRAAGVRRGRCCCTCSPRRSGTARNADYGYGTLFGVGHGARDRHAAAGARRAADAVVRPEVPALLHLPPDPVDLVKDPNGDDTLAAPLGTYTASTRVERSLTWPVELVVGDRRRQRSAARRPQFAARVCSADGRHPGARVRLRGERHGPAGRRARGRDRAGRRRESPTR